MQRYVFTLNISPEELLDYYRGTAPDVLARCASGVVIQFPASLLKAFVSSTGIHGNFLLTCEDNHKGAKLQRLPPRT
jgi:hypothetical protein